jgi:hypothetical protein
MTIRGQCGNYITLLPICDNCVDAWNSHRTSSFLRSLAFELRRGLATDEFQAKQWCWNALKKVRR